LSLFAINLDQKENPFWQVFLNRHAGVQILHRLMVSAPDDTEYPPRAPLPFSTSDLAREFRVSRPHVARLLKAAAEAGLVAVDGNTLILTEDVKAHLRKMMGLRLATAIVAAALTHREQLGEANLPARAGADRGLHQEELAPSLS
jgi:hypothetical protein